MFVSSVARRHIARICTNPIYSIKVSKCALFLNIENASEKSVPQFCGDGRTVSTLNECRSRNERVTRLKTAPNNV